MSTKIFAHFLIGFFGRLELSCVSSFCISPLSGDTDYFYFFKNESYMVDVYRSSHKMDLLWGILPSFYILYSKCFYVFARLLEYFLFGFSHMCTLSNVTLNSSLNMLDMWGWSSLLCCHDLLGTPPIYAYNFNG